MSSIVTVLFILIGHYAGKTVRLGKWLFEDGKLQITGPAEEVALVARSLERNWQAYPEGHPALEALKQKEEDNGERDISSERTGSDGGSEVSGAVQPEGAGTATGVENPEGAGHAESVAGTSEELAQRDGQSESVNQEPPKDENREPEADLNVKLRDAVFKLDPNDDDHWTRDGKPAMTAVERFYGSSDVTRVDVDAVTPGYNRAAAAAKVAQG